jgi:hypothetical protein
MLCGSGALQCAVLGMFLVQRKQYLLLVLYERWRVVKDEVFDEIA